MLWKLLVEIKLIFTRATLC